MKNPNKGFQHLLDATRFSLQGLKWGSQETVFKQYAMVLIPLTIALIFLPFGIVHKGVLLVSHVFVLMVELINTAIEKVVDRTGEEYHELSGQAKDLGSAAVMLAIIIVVILWLSMLIHYFA